MAEQNPADPASDRVTAPASAPASAAPAEVGTATDTGPRRYTSAIVGMAIGAVVLIAAVAFANSGTGGETSAPVGATTDIEVIDAATAAAGVEISLIDMKVVPAAIAVEPGADLVLHVTNDGAMTHDLLVEGRGQTPLLRPGESATLEVGVVDRDLDGWCTVPGHRSAGMTMQIFAGAPATGPSSSGVGTDTPGAGGMHGMMHGGPADAPPASSADLAAEPPAGWAPIDASLPPAPDQTVHEVTWHVQDVVTAVAPDVTQTLWTFDGRVPGPVLRGNVGDRFEVTLVNDTQMTHNVDFHAMSGPPSEVMTWVPPGESHTYSFVATHAGAWLYHCSVDPMMQHMANGMYGALIIDPPDLTPADAEYVLVASELFFGPEGGIADVAKAMADQPDAVVFNGYPFAYDREPLTATVGDLVRIWVVDAGPSRSVAFHVIGAPFTTQYLNGAYLLRDGWSQGVESGGAQTLPVDPGNGGFVELRFSRPGSYPFLTHAMADAMIGAAGSFTVTG